MRIISGSRAALHHEVTCKRRSPRYRAPRGLRELGLLIRDRPDGPTVKEAASPMVRYAAQMHADVSFLRRELRTVDSIPLGIAAAIAVARQNMPGMTSG